MMPKLLRISTVPHSLDLLLKGQLKYVSQHGFEVISASNGEGGVKNIETREEVKHYRLPYTRKLSPLRDLISLIYTISLILKTKPTIVHTHSPKAGIIGMLSAYICRVPLKIHTVAGLPLMETSGLKKRILILVEKIAYFCADFVLPNSHNQKGYILKNICNKNKIQVIGMGSSNGIDLSYYNPDSVNDHFIADFKQKKNIQPDTTVFCFVGRLVYYKGVNEIIQMFKILDKKYTNIKLILVGPFENLYPLEQETLKEIDKNENIINVGHQDDIRPYLKMADIFLFPSYREGFPQSLMQAAAMNLACIASDINGCNEILDNNISGILIEPKNADALYHAAETLLNDKKLQYSLAKKARLKMEAFYEQNKFWDEIISFYNNNLPASKKSKGDGIPRTKI
ncbi:glycosyltransferase family 4 protein [Niabella hirudinis]|uniref:glycosyltransferase family 4 protein n=1 Tax=Niabella hirudinis TaxID=1285929 RepID=UPI003EBA985A